VTLHTLIMQLQAIQTAVGSDAPVVLQMEEHDDYNEGTYLCEPTVEVRMLRVKGRGAPALSKRKSEHDRKGVVLL
jgi:hypothetical protein